MRRAVQRATLAVIVACAAQGLAAAGPGDVAVAQACQVEITVDQPSENAQVSARQRITGWAVDRAATAGTGIEAVRVALDPPEGSTEDGLFLPLVYGVPRADVAYVLRNPRFATAGFAQEWAAVGTPAGRHRLVIQAKSACGWTTLTRHVRIAPPPPGTDTIQEVPVRLLLDDPGPIPIIGPPGLGPGVSPLDRTPPVPVSVTRPHFPLTATVAAPTSATLTWEAVPNAVSYNVYAADETPVEPPPAGARGPNALQSTGRGLQRVRSALPETTVTVAGLNSGAPYRFTVRAVSAGGSDLAASDVVRLTLPAGGNTALTVTGSSGAVALSWAPVPEAVTYALLAASAGGPLVADSDRTSLTGTSASVDRLPPGAYTFQIEARDAAGGRVAQSNRAQVTVDGTGGAVSTVASAAAAAPPAVAAPGMPPSGVVVPMPPSAGGAPGMLLPGAMPPAPGAPPAAFAIPPAAGPGGVPPASLGPPGLPGAAGAGFPLTLRPTGADSARLDWLMLPGATSYALYQSQGSTPLAFAFTTGQGNTTLSGLTNTAGYTFQVRARNAADQELGTSVSVTFGPGQ